MRIAPPAVNYRSVVASFNIIVVGRQRKLTRKPTKTRHMSVYKHWLTFRVRRYVVMASKPVHRLQIRRIVHN